MESSDSDGEEVELSPEASKFLDKHVTYLELLRMTDPLRSANMVLVATLIDTLKALRDLVPEGESKERADAAWKKLGEVFPALEDYTTRHNAIFQGRETWKPADDQNHD
jgi:hypothetical protein